MGVRILDNGDTAAFYCSTSEVAFGPLIYEDGVHDAVERAEAFLRWLSQDARLYSNDELLNYVAMWRAQEAEQWAREAGCQNCGTKWEGEAMPPPTYCDDCETERRRDEAAEQAHDTNR